MRSYLDWMMAIMQLTLIRRYRHFVHFLQLLHHNGMSRPNLISCIWTVFGFCAKTLTCACSRISRSGRKTVCFRLTRVQSGTPTVFSLCSGKCHVMQQYYTILEFYLYYVSHYYSAASSMVFLWIFLSCMVDLNYLQRLFYSVFDLVYPTARLIFQIDF